MLTVDWQHIILAASGYFGTSRRIARMRGAGASFAHPYLERHWTVDGDTWSPNTDEAGRAPDSYSPFPIFPDLYGDRTYVFAFWSVNGLSSTRIPFRLIPDGRIPSISLGREPWTLNAKAWYVWDRNSGGKGGGPGEHGVEVDAFNWTSNDFIPDYFVDIGPDGPPEPRYADLGPLTYTVNEDGYVSTESLTEPITIKARMQFEDASSRYQFSHWQIIHRFTSGNPIPEVNGSTITVHRQNTMKAYAIYDQVMADVREPGQVEDALRTYALYDQAGRPFIFVGPLGEPQPLPLEDTMRLIEILQQAEKNLQEPFKLALGKA
jgi:hypothetical protein